MQLSDEARTFAVIYQQLVDMNGWSGARANFSWVLNNKPVVIALLEQIKGEAINYAHMGHRMTEGKFCGLIRKKSKSIDYGNEGFFWKDDTEYLLIIQDGYKKRRLSLNKTRIWHPAIHAAYLTMK